MSGANPFQVVVRRDTLPMWKQHDPVLGRYEPVLTLNSDGGPEGMKLGDGERRWSELPDYIPLDRASLKSALDEWDGDALVTKRHAESLLDHLCTQLGIEGP